MFLGKCYVIICREIIGFKNINAIFDAVFKTFNVKKNI